MGRALKPAYEKASEQSAPVKTWHGENSRTLKQGSVQNTLGRKRPLPAHESVNFGKSIFHRTRSAQALPVCKADDRRHRRANRDVQEERECQEWHHCAPQFHWLLAVKANPQRGGQSIVSRGATPAVSQIGFAEQTWGLVLL